MRRAWYRWRELWRQLNCRLRVHYYRIAGGRAIHHKCLFDRGVRIERPWLAQLGQRCTLHPNVWLNIGVDNARLTIGEYTFLGRNVEIRVNTSVEIGRGCLIAPGVFMTDHNHGTSLGQPMFEQPCISASIHIGDDVWIGANAVILPGVEIGTGAVVAAGAVVTGAVAAGTIVGGVPARVIRHRANLADRGEESRRA